MGKRLEVGDTIPMFTLKNEIGEDIEIKKELGKPMVIYFYPKDDTPGCTKEACYFRDQYTIFSDMNVKVIGISADSPERHLKFKQKYQLPFTLLSDNKNIVRKQFGVPTNLFGIIPGRVTYIIDSKGKIYHIFNSQTNATQHVEESIKALKKLNNS